MATFNGEKYIKEQLLSILCQLSEDDEVIISDDCSTDSTLDVVRSLGDNRIKVYKNAGNIGYTRNFENAISRATGDILFISDQDDVWQEGKVRRMLEALQNADLVVSDAEIVDADLKLLHRSHFELYGIKKGFWINLLKTRYIGACTAFRREVLRKALPFPDRYALCAYDYWLVNVAELYYNLVLEKAPLIKYRRHGTNASTGGVESGNSLRKRISVRLYVLYQLFKRRKN